VVVVSRAHIANTAKRPAHDTADGEVALADAVG
jgi:hypothetical protein